MSPLGIDRLINQPGTICLLGGDGFHSRPERLDLMAPVTEPLVDLLRLCGTLFTDIIRDHLAVHKLV